MKQSVKKILWSVLCVSVFVIAFLGSAAVKVTSLLGVNANFTLQGEVSGKAIKMEDYSSEKIDISYITNEGTVETRPLIVYKLNQTKGDLPVIYVPHYEAEEKSSDIQSYLKNGWMVASPADVKNEYNGELTGNDLVFNNAALYTLKNMDGVDDQRIALVGGSAGGYMTLMLSELQLGVTASIANSPVTNVYFNFYHYLKETIEVNKNAGIFEIPLFVPAMISGMFEKNNENFPDPENIDRWEALSPVGIAKTISSPIVINHYTADVLVPVDQVSKQFTYAFHDDTLPEDFSTRLPENYPGILSRSFEEEANPKETFVQKLATDNNRIDREMPFSSKLLTINIIDDGPVTSKSSHTSPTTTGQLDTVPYLRNMFLKSLTKTEQLVPEKIILLLERYQGNSEQLPAHEGIDDTVYGSLAMYQQEIDKDLTLWAKKHSIEELNSIVNNSISLVDKEKQRDYRKTWETIKNNIKFDDSSN